MSDPVSWHVSFLFTHPLKFPVSGQNPFSVCYLMPLWLDQPSRTGKQNSEVAPCSALVISVIWG